VPLCAVNAAGCMCESACICERLSIRADFVKLANRVIEHTSIRHVRVWLLLFVCGGLFLVAGVPWVSEPPLNADAAELVRHTATSRCPCALLFGLARPEEEA